MRLPWSISTTVREPDRLRNFLVVLKQLEGETWDNDAQVKYQTLLIKERVYGFGNQQFYNASRQCKALTKEQIQLLESAKPLSYKQAKDIFETKSYVDPAMRGRQSINPLEKLGLVKIDNRKIKISSLGKYFLQEDCDLGEIFFRSFVKWQLPNPSNHDYKESEGYNIKPFIGTLHLINKVNQLWSKLKKNPVGISREEFILFAPTLINYRDINKQAQKIVKLRRECEGKSKQEQKKLKERYKVKFAQYFLSTNKREAVEKLLKNLKDYGDNAIRYFRLTRYMYIRGEGFYIDLEPRRQVEIDNLLKFDNGKSLPFPNEEAYLDYIADIKQPTFPWETEPELIKIAETIERETQALIKELVRKKVAIQPFKQQDYRKFKKEDLKQYIEQLRIYRRSLNDAKISYESQEIKAIEEYIKGLKEIYHSDQKSIELERLATLALNALNDALNIKPNYPVGDNNEPTFTAPANKPDIECFYLQFNSVCEVTMLTNRSQWYQEGQPVMRHLRDFENSYPDKQVFCIFIAPRIHRDTINTFWHATKYEYEGTKQRIIPLTIEQLVELLEILLKLKKNSQRFNHKYLVELYSKIIEITDSINKSDLWLEKIPETINQWKETILTAK